MIGVGVPDDGRRAMQRQLAAALGSLTDDRGYLMARRAAATPEAWSPEQRQAGDALKEKLGTALVAALVGQAAQLPGQALSAGLARQERQEQRGFARDLAQQERRQQVSDQAAQRRHELELERERARLRQQREQAAFDRENSPEARTRQIRETVASNLAPTNPQAALELALGTGDVSGSPAVQAQQHEAVQAVLPQYVGEGGAVDQAVERWRDEGHGASWLNMRAAKPAILAERGAELMDQARAQYGAAADPLVAAIERKLSEVLYNERPNVGYAGSRGDFADAIIKLKESAYGPGQAGVSRESIVNPDAVGIPGAMVSGYGFGPNYFGS